VAALAHDLRPDPESLERKLGRLVRRRQELRALAASADVLEANRRDIVRLQRLLSTALIARYAPHPG